MELQLTGKNIELTPEMRSHIERKLSKLVRHLPNIIECRTEVFEEKTKSRDQHFTVGVTVLSSGAQFHGKGRGADIFTAADKAAAVMTRQLDHHKGKLYEKSRGSSLARSGFSPSTETAESEGQVASIERYAVKPMSVAEALDQINLLGQDFFLFFNDDTQKLNLLHRRKDGKYGLIEPEVG